MEIRRAKEQDMDWINKLLLQVCLVHHIGRPDLFKYGAKKYTDEAYECLEHFDGNKENLKGIAAYLLERNY